ncbi:unnamed protein product [Penicillium pancosmium]
MSGIPNKAAIDGHDIIHKTKAEEERRHERDDDSKNEAKQNDTPEAIPADSAEVGQKESALGKVKDVFHRQARRAESGP